MEQSKEPQPVPEEIKHTPGPWFAVEYSGYWEIQLADGYSTTGNLLDEGSNPNAEIDARLMASAPSLLSIIQNLNKTVERLAGERESLQKTIEEQKKEIEELQERIDYLRAPY